MAASTSERHGCATSGICAASVRGHRASKPRPLFARAKAETLQLKLAQQKRELVSKADFDAMIGTFAGVTLTALSSMPARCAPRGDLATRRAIDRVVFEVRTEIAKVCLEMADKCGEPPLEQQV
jgi:phage terminase Nu1 subunit (DNA packaging protein)